MKTKLLALLAVVTTLSALAQTPASDDIISRSPEPETDSDAMAETRSMRGDYSASAVAAQLTELRRIVDETVSMLDAFTLSNAAVATPATSATSGGITGILEAILNRNSTNPPPTSDSTRSTNLLGGILRGVLGTNAPAAPTSINTATLNDLVALRQQLQSISPILARLDSGALSTNQFVQPASNSSTNELMPTGRD